MRPAERFDFDEHNCVAIHGDQVDFAKLIPHLLCEDAKPLGAQILRGQTLALVPQPSP